MKNLIIAISAMLLISGSVASAQGVARHPGEGDVQRYGGQWRYQHHIGELATSIPTCAGSGILSTEGGNGSASESPLTPRLYIHGRTWVGSTAICTIGKIASRKPARVRASARAPTMQKSWRGKIARTLSF